MCDAFLKLRKSTLAVYPAWCTVGAERSGGSHVCHAPREAEPRNPVYCARVLCVLSARVPSVFALVCNSKFQSLFGFGVDSRSSWVVAAAAMIEYERTEWFGLSYLYKMRGSVLPRCLPAMLLGMAISAAVEVAEGYYDEEVIIGDKYSMQLFGLVFGYLSIGRLNISYQRYWEGASMMHIMHSKWADAASQALAFDRIDDAREEIADDFCLHVVRLFAQFSAMATATLHMSADELVEMWAHLEAELAAKPASSSSAFAMVPISRQAAPHDEGVGPAPSAPRDGSGGGGSGGGGSGGVAGGGAGAVACRALLLSELFDATELAYLRDAPCPVLCTEHRLSRAISTRFRSRGWRAPAPVVSRIFQEMSSGMVACTLLLRRGARTLHWQTGPICTAHIQISKRRVCPRPCSRQTHPFACPTCVRACAAAQTTRRARSPRSRCRSRTCSSTRCSSSSSTSSRRSRSDRSRRRRSSRSPPPRSRARGSPPCMPPWS